MIKRESHGMTGTKEYKSWQHMKARVLTPSTHNYCDYGGCGIEISEEFKCFTKFIEHVGFMPKDSQKYTIGRIDNNKGYVLGNIRWENNFQQARNKGRMTNNTSGFNGVLWNRKISTNIDQLYAVSVWYTLEGKMKRKYFSTKVFGLMPAFYEACKYRKEMIEELNKQGAGYSENHGK